MLGHLNHGLAVEEKGAKRKVIHRTDERRYPLDYAESVRVMKSGPELKVKQSPGDGYCTDEPSQQFASCHQDLNDTATNPDAFHEMELESNSEIRTCNVGNSPVVESNEHKNEPSEISVLLQNEETFSNFDESELEPGITPEQESLFENPAVPKYFRNYVEGCKVPGDSKCALGSKPSWVDADKFRTGQQVALKYLFGLQLAQLLSLVLVINGPGGSDPLVFTGKSDTPFKAFKRYLSTALRVRSWYLDDFWTPQTEGYRNLKTVRAMHDILRKNLEATDPEERKKRSTLSGRCNSGCPAIWSTLQDELREDFERSCPYPMITESEFKKFHDQCVLVNQTEMCMTQFAFVGLFVKYPAYFGAHRITEKELDSFVHLWRCIGHQLGVEDKYNFCSGDLETVRQRSTDLLEHIYKPSLRRISQDWEHMTRCINVGISYYVPGVTFEVSLQYLCDILGLRTPRLWASLTFGQKVTYYLMYFTIWIVMRIPGSEYYHNRLVNRAMSRAENASPELLKEWEERKYPYQENADCT